MRIASFRIENYKSFYQPPDVHLTSGFNVIVGQNNVGKTALVEALTIGFAPEPHRSLETVRLKGIPLSNDKSSIEITFELDRNELIDVLDMLPEIYVPLASGDAQADVDKFLKAISDRNVLRCLYKTSGGFVKAYLEAYGDYGGQDVVQLKVDRTAKQVVPSSLQLHKVTFDRSYGVLMAYHLRGLIYKFNAERMNIGEAQMGPGETLAPDARDLPRVIDILQSDTSRFRRFTQAVNSVLPQVKEVIAKPISDNVARLYVATVDPDLERRDLDVELAKSGTGIGQVVSILYVVLTSDHPRVIIIDEPQSFLHPGAVRKLFDILKQDKRHQYIITTHSPTAVTAANPQTLLLLRLIEAQSTIETVSFEDTEQLGSYLAEIGARLSDVFGADNILWVEGPTEEHCFPLIVSKILGKQLLGTAILGVRETGELVSGRHAEMVVRVYERLCRGRGLLPPAVGFIFDRELHSDEEITELEKRGLSFIRRRMYENYLLNPQAIAEIMTAIPGFRDTPVTEDEINNWLGKHKWDTKYIRVKAGQAQTNELWQKTVDSAKLLDDMFNELSEARVSYNNYKVAHGLALTKWILENAPHELQEVAELIGSKLLQ